MAKTFETLFKITGKYLAGPVFNALNRDIDRTEKKVKQAHLSFGKLTGAMFSGQVAANVAGRAWRGFVATLDKAFDAAMDVEKAHQGLGNALERNWDRYKTLGRTVNGVTEELIALAEAQEKVAFDAEDLEQGYTKLLDAMAPDQVKAFSQAFSDITAKLKGASAGADDFKEVAGQIDLALLQGRPALLRQLNWTDKQIKAFKELSFEGRIAALQEFAQTRLHGETARAFETTAGKISQMRTQLGNLYETLGKPFATRAGKIADSLKDINVSLGPIAEILAKITDEELDKMSKWFKDHKTEIPENLTIMLEILIKIKDTLQTIEDFTYGNLFKLLKAFRDLLRGGVPARMPVIPGSPTGVNPALQQGEAGRRAEEARKKAEDRDIAQRQWGGTGRYYSKGQVYPISADSAPASVYVGNLKDVRERFAKELQDPKVQQLLMASTQAEVGNQSETFWQAYMESVMNRAASRKMTLKEALLDEYDPRTRKGYYPHQTIRQLGETFSAAKTEKMRKLYESVLGGSNVANYATGNESAGVQSGGAPVLFPLNAKRSGAGERFVGEIADLKWIEAQRAEEAKRKKATANTWKFATEEEEKRTGGKGPNYDAVLGGGGAPSETVRKATKVIKEPFDPQHPLGKNPWGLQYGSWNQPTPAPPPKSLNYGAPRNVPTGSSLKDIIKDINMKQRMEGSTGGTNVASNPTINVHGVPAGQEGAVASAVTKTMRQSSREFLASYKKARSDDQRLGYV
jgi:hypothetical protein